ncbi:putative alpha,alpha-trehalose-phosphate synthase subunit [Talaromyces proteolyticus]|uniref:alpha,alpha-trehalose-phosphate synthase (UDP-forming) n=1 Tax=Talaromyces proteolyticus TaxID=1131652 RepID=A0AAD4KDY6_9EURO|nr:putative alpha,alpha-trehalose-phosphate synthase subunit [Talaromyces proteolyticus]KAH8689957.1 putative alpha,alpha-trehalose-phosphate synthase subunit [Talaromyces proteolyticus]
MPSIEFAPDTKRNLIVVSNRLPLSVKRNEDGSYQACVSSGGLVTSLSGLTKTTSFRWFGWPGLSPTEPSEREEIRRSLAAHNAMPVFLDEKLAQAHYNGFSNSILWPTLHYQSGVAFDDEPWKAYIKVNEIFADYITDAAQNGELIWVHDYHLMLLPQMVRERMLRKGKSACIGFSLHTPFPAGEALRVLPVAKELLQGMLSSTLVGFHTDDYKLNFTESCQNLLGAQPQDSTILYKDRLVRVGRFTVGIDPEKFTETLKVDQVQSRIEQLGERYKGVKLILGVDRLDYIKGLTQKLHGYEQFLTDYPNWQGKIVLIQVAVPSREDVREYQDLETQISCQVGKINGRFGKPEYSPIIYLHRSIPFTELAALYSVADICLLTSHRDGMNLVAFEYVACQEQRNGVLVLSEFAGASAFMGKGAVQFHPANIKEISQSIHKALLMSKEERKERYDMLRHFVDTNTSTRWGQTFVEELSKGAV